MEKTFIVGRNGFSAGIPGYMEDFENGIMY